MVNAVNAIITDHAIEESILGLRLQIIANAKIVFGQRLGPDYANFVKANMTPVMMFDVVLVTEDSASDTPTHKRPQPNRLKALLVYQETVANPMGRVVAEGAGARTMPKALESLLSILIFGVTQLKGHSWQPMDKKDRTDLEHGAIDSSFLQ